MYISIQKKKKKVLCIYDLSNENLEKMENSNGYEQRNIERMTNVKGVILLHA